MMAMVAEWESVLRQGLKVLCALGLGLVVSWITLRILRGVADRSTILTRESITKHCRRPIRWLLVTVVLRLSLDFLDLPDDLTLLVNHILSLILIAAIAWFIVKLTYLLDDFVTRQYRVDVSDNLQARKIHTQLRVFKRIVIVVVCIIAVAMMLMTFDRVRQLGVTLLASAGIIGIIVGMAAQRTLATFIAGIQIAVTQPIRLDDVVIVEGEWGRIEEITLTYVVVRIWDLRRLIVPITYFIEKPFQNWTRVSADLLGTVCLYVDYTVSVDAVREELRRILEKAEPWDGKVCGLQVTNCTDRTMELRALMSASDASKAWELRCLVRERLIGFIQERYPKSLPRIRAEMSKLEI